MPPIITQTITTRALVTTLDEAFDFVRSRSTELPEFTVLINPRHDSTTTDVVGYEVVVSGTPTAPPAP